MAHVLIVGKSFSGLKKFLVNNNHTYTILRDELTTKFPDKKYKHQIICSFQDRASYLKAAHDINNRSPIDATVTIYENYVVPNAIIATEFGLPGMSEESATACTDKEIMRSKFAVSTEKVSPDFHVVESRQSLIDFAQEHDFPLILKPANLAKSLLVTKNDSLEELLANYDKALTLTETTYKKYAPNNTPKFIVEEFLHGSIHSVDAFVDSTGEPHVLEQVVDYQTGHDIGFEDNFHYSRQLPSRLSENDIAAIRHTAALGCRLLGMKSSPAHVEIILTESGPRIVEIGARNGGYRERMHWLANGIDILQAALAIAMGEKPDITATRNDFCAVLELFPKVPGVFLGINEYETLKVLPSLQYINIKATEGKFVGKAGDGFKMVAVVILSSDDSQQFFSDLSAVSERHQVITQA